MKASFVSSAFALSLLLGLAACASAPADGLRFDKPVVLLGEVHDHPQQHALRLQALREHLATGARPALLMEQFDRQHQAATDAAPREVAAIVAAGQGGKGWNWSFYEPFIALALQHGLPIVAANVGRDDARRVMREGLAAQGFDAQVDAATMAEHTRAIVVGHCNKIDGITAGRMALAQVARDQFMARTVAAHAARGAVLLAGNGHVRTDIGVPRWLDAATRARTQAIGVLERGQSSSGASGVTATFDRVVVTEPHPRPDPCAGL
jgi:uncharacterized iron-regulated protein